MEHLSSNRFYTDFLNFPRLLVMGLTALAVTCAVFQTSPALAEKARHAAQHAAASPPADQPAAATSPSSPACVPQKVLIVGDSFAVGLGLTMEHSLRPLGAVALASRGKVSSGLNSPRFYDWEKALGEFLNSEKPDTMVVMLGGNDAKNGQGTPQWSQDFQAKAKRFLDIAGSHGIKVYWVGLPPMREQTFSRKAWVTNEAMRAACGSSPSCRFIDSWDLFADASGNYRAKKPVAGKAVSLRGKDGVHFTVAGCRLLTDRIASGIRSGQ